MENLTDRQAADAVRSRLDWKYALSLELTDPGFDHTVLSEFRTRLVALTAQERFLEAVLTLCKEHGWRHPHVGVSGPIRPTFWPRSAPSIEQNVWWKRYATLSMFWPLQLLTGGFTRCSQTGWSAMDTALMSIASPLERTSASSSCFR